EGLGYALTAIAISLALLAYPAYLGIRSRNLPRIYDITTDPIDPPRYEALARIRPRDANPTVYAALSAAEQQRSGYPDIETLEAAANVHAASEAAHMIVTRRRCRIVEAPPAPAAKKGKAAPKGNQPATKR